MELLLQIFLEFLVQVVGGILLDLILHTSSRVPRLSKSSNALHTAFLFFVVGCAIGGFSVWLFPQAFIRSSTLHGMSLVITPTIAGLVMSAIGWFRLRTGKLVVHLESFSYGFILSLIHI